MHNLLREEETFYRDYAWCLDPMPAWADLSHVFIAELARWQKGAKGWQEREIAGNCWLMASALWQTICDHRVRGANGVLRACRPGADERQEGVGRLRALGALIDRKYVRLRSLTFERHLARYDEQWNMLLRKLSHGIIAERPVPVPEKSCIENLAYSVLSYRYPRSLLSQRIKIPSAFRSQDLTPGDFIRLLDEFTRERARRYQPLVVVGVRTTGAYLAPLAGAFLESRGIAVTYALSVRPGEYLAAPERGGIRSGIEQNADFVVIAEAPRSGASLEGAVELLAGQGVRKDRIAVLFPEYPAGIRWRNRAWAQEVSGVRRYTLPWNRWHRSEELRPENVRKVLAEYYAAQDAQLVSVEEFSLGKNVDSRFGRPDLIGWRLKQVYRVRLWGRDGAERSEEIVAKSVGWGWLGYHAFIQADRLPEFVPPLLGLRSGVLFMRWLSGPSCQGPDVETERVIPMVLSYIFARTERLSLAEDPTFKDYSRRYAGGRFLSAILGRAYGKRLGRAIQPLLRRILLRYATKIPAVIDGKMAPEKWILDGDGVRKVDFEHHGFGATELNIADPVFDLASFIFEFRLNESLREKVIDAYAARTGDPLARSKTMMYLWLIAHCDQEREREFLVAPNAARRAIEENRKYASGRRYINLVSMEYSSRLLPSPGQSLPGTHRAHGERCFVIDIDGMLDREIWDFPTVSAAGIRAVSLLRHNGYQVFINTVRSVAEMKAYCEYFSFEGGIAENGSVIWDNVRKRQATLPAHPGLQELAEVRRLILQDPGTYIYPYYDTIVRAFHHRGGGTVGLDTEKLRRLMEQRDFRHVKVASGASDTVIMARGIDKGTGLEAIFSRFFARPKTVITVGLTEADLPVIERSDLAFVTKSLAAASITLARRGSIRILKAQRNGLLEAVRSAVSRYGRRSGAPVVKTGSQQLMLKFMEIADRSRLGRVMSALGSIREG